MSMSQKRLISPLKAQNGTKMETNKKIKLQSDGKEDDYFDDSDDLLDWDAWDMQLKQLKQLDLSVWQRCLVEEIINDKRSHSIILNVKGLPLFIGDENSDDVQHLYNKCILRGSWYHTNISKGDILSLKGVWDDKLKAYCINQNGGICVTKPDILISGTTVMGSLFCRRKAVLQERFRGIDANSKIMVIGSLVHELLQTVLQKRQRTLFEIHKTADNLLDSPTTSYVLYANQMTFEETLNEIVEFIPHIVKFMNQYMKETSSPVSAVPGNEDFQGCITDIEDIEENLWVPQLGLKGKIDVSVRIHRDRNTKKLSKSIHKENCLSGLIPLEVKTGRASFSMEHKGQLILYQMMLSATNRPTESGLLLYLRESIMREIEGTYNEQRDLINLRNDLCHYLMAEPVCDAPNAVLPQNKYKQPFLLPEPITYAKACEQCPYQLLCCTFAKTDPDFPPKSNYGIENLITSNTNHLRAKDFEYFFNWCHVLVKEEMEVRKGYNMANIWTRKRSERQKLGMALGDLILSSQTTTYNDSQISHDFKYNEAEMNETNVLDFTLTDFSVGEYVIVSTYKRLAVAAGIITKITFDCITINLERNLCKKYASDKFIIDKHDSVFSHTFNFTNLGILMDNSERSQMLRDIIIEGAMPEFSNGLPENIQNRMKNILEPLNPEQQNAVRKALLTQTYLLIKGLPGTGKTQTLIAIIRLFYSMNSSVLVTSHTHSAVDNILLRLKDEDIPFLRLGSSNRVHPSLEKFTENYLTRKCKSVAALTKIYNSYSIVGVTCLGCSHPIFLYREFDICIIDEATQVMQPTVLRPLFYSKRFILVGDPHQLSPLVRSSEARQLGADISLFERLTVHKDSTVTLSVQYRMNSTITKLANRLTYGGHLKCATKSIEQAIMRDIIHSDISDEKWLELALQNHIEHAVVLLDTLNCSVFCYHYEQQKKRMYGKEIEDASTYCNNNNKLIKYTNYCEAVIIFYIIHALLEKGYKGRNIGIIAPYRGQVDLLKQLLNQYHKYYNDWEHNNLQSILNFSTIEINTVDQYQGRDKDIIIYSCTRTGPHDARGAERDSIHTEILEDKRRLTVAITRAKIKLIIIGDAAYMKQYTPFDKLINNIPNFCKQKLEDNKNDFQWHLLFDQLRKVQLHSLKYG